ncbi:MAG: ABC transporter ATP-binding protein [Candidatus Paceibacterota bacterium]
MAADGSAASEQMGNLAFLVEGLEALNFNLNLTLVLLTMLFFFTAKGLMKFLEQYKSVIYRQYFIRNLREENINLLSTYDYEAFVNADAGRIQNTMSGEIARVSAALNYYIGLMQYSVLVLVYTVLAFMANAQFALLVIVGGALTNLLFNRLYTATKQYSKKLTQDNHRFQGLLIQKVAFFKYLKATGNLNKYAKKLISMVYGIETSQRKIGVLGAIMTGIREPMMIGVVVAVILIQVNFLGGSLGLILLSILFFYRALGSVMSLQRSWNQFLGMSGSLENLEEFTYELKKDRERTGERPFTSLDQIIELKDISFSYGNIPVLHDIRLTIHKNETVALVGESGSGKTTLMNILSGLLTPSIGMMKIDGLDSTLIRMPTFQQRIGYITQEPVIFSDTIYNNVTFWDDDSEGSRERFVKALKRARIYDFVQGLPEKEKTLLGSNGINLSGGQKQRISIARELFKEVDFLFLDEATSALDSETEKEIQDNLDQLKGQYTIVIIAHRLSTIKHADRVVVIDKGRIERVGTYQELIGVSGIFRKMVDLQKI